MKPKRKSQKTLIKEWFAEGKELNLIFTPVKPGEKPREETLKINKSKRTIGCSLNIYHFQDGEYLMSVIPSLSLSGYGVDKESSLEMIKESLSDYFSSLLDQDQISADLSKHGWSKNKFSRKKEKRFMMYFTKDLHGFEQEMKMKKAKLVTYDGHKKNGR